MYSGTALAKSAAVAATFTSTFFILPQYAAAHLNDDTVLYKGMHSDEIKTIQSILKATGDYPLAKSTGYFGNNTEKAVKQFQEKNDLVTDGVVGAQTKEALIAYINKNMDILSRGSKGNKVAYLQEILNRVGFKNLPVDGYFGEQTEMSVFTLQKATSIQVDGIVGQQTWGSIEKLLQKPKPLPDSTQSTKTEDQSKQAQSQPATNQPKKQTRVIRKTETVAAVKEFYANSTAYTARCTGCSGTTATGIDLIKNPNTKVIAVDPSVIPLGTKLYVEGYGYAIAGDTGGAIKGRKIDVFFNSNSDALQWGRRTVKVRVLD
ncbi:peptidoglycan-binding protein [Sporolactobacillus laevolacticus]|uniref:peptidoglycan-binding protein n=1 Tax=Sporolactobacillus laevolacticus TaxID=33018 RepID=UPI0025B3E18C|nr:peptidoglycan-binding protein [Sporolactobacillus laevolacticus]MDN3955385.1 peptidoglycan-binding protein [Sporolactobacillus laevolacticus]